MKRKLLKFLPIIAISSIMLSGCTGGSGVASDMGSMKMVSNSIVATDGVASNDYSYDSYEDMDYSEAAYAEEPSVTTNESTKDTMDVSEMDQKLIRNVSLNIKTLSLDDSMKSIKDLVSEYKGYVSNSEYSDNSYSYRYQTLTIRIPYNKVDEFLSKASDIGTITRSNDSSEDITLSYSDNEDRISSLRIEYDRLNELLGKADDLDTIIALENRLSNVRYELSSYESQKKLWDSLIIYSTIDITLEEESYITPVIEDESIGSRIKQGLSDTFNDIKTGVADLVVLFIVKLPYILIWGVIAIIFIAILNKIIKKSNCKKREKQIKPIKDETLDETVKEENDDTK